VQRGRGVGSTCGHHQPNACADFGNEDPVGQKIKFSTFEEWAADWPRDAYFEIIGIIADTKNTGLQDAPIPEVYFPYTVTGTGPRDIMVRTASNSTLVLESLRREIAAMDSDVAVSDGGSIETFLKRRYYAGPQFTLIILTTFGVIGWASSASWPTQFHCKRMRSPFRGTQ